MPHAVSLSPAVFVAALEQAQDALVLVDPEDNICFCNQAAKRYWARDLLGCPLASLWQSGDGAFPRSAACSVSGVEDGLAGIPDNWVRVGDPESPRWVECSISPVTLSSGKIVRLVSARDVSAHWRRFSAQHYLSIATRAETRAVVVVGHEGRILFVSQEFARLSGSRAEYWCGRNILRLLMRTESNRRAWERIRQFTSNRQALHEELYLRISRRRGVWVSATLNPTQDIESDSCQWVVLVVELADRGRLRSLQSDVLELSIRERPLSEILSLICWRIDSIAARAVASVLLVDENGSVCSHIGPGLPEYYLKAMEGITIRSEMSGCGTAVHRGEPQYVPDINAAPEWAPFREMLLPFDLRTCWSLPIVLADGRITGAFCLHFRHHDEPSAWYEHLAHLCVSLCAMVVGRDQSQRRIVRLVYRKMALGATDCAELWRRVEQALNLAAVNSGNLAFLLSDIDDFCHIRTHLGEENSERLLECILDRLQGQLRAEDIIGRIGSDQFVIVLQDCDAERANEVVKRLTRALQAPIELEQKKLLVTLSTGISLMPTDGMDVDTLLKYADKAMYEVKRAGGAGYRFSSLLV